MGAPRGYSIHAWDQEAAEAHSRIRADAKRLDRSAGAFDIMIAAHAGAPGATLVTSDEARVFIASRGASVDAPITPLAGVAYNLKDWPASLTRKAKNSI
jgi:hypothetical protein